MLANVNSSSLQSLSYRTFSVASVEVGLRWQGSSAHNYGFPFNKAFSAPGHIIFGERVHLNAYD
jgi:hypothetical protein